MWPDMWDDTHFGRDDGIRCDCGGTTYLVDDQGFGLITYQCETCEESFQVQYDWDDESGEPDDYWEMPGDEARLSTTPP